SDGRDGCGRRTMARIGFASARRSGERRLVRRFDAHVDRLGPSSRSSSRGRAESGGDADAAAECRRAADATARGRAVAPRGRPRRRATPARGDCPPRAPLDGEPRLRRGDLRYDGWNYGGASTTVAAEHITPAVL